MNHALDFFKKNSRIFDICILLQPTNPLRTTKMIDYSIEILINSDADSVVSISDVGGVTAISYLGVQVIGTPAGGFYAGAFSINYSVHS